MQPARTAEPIAQLHVRVGQFADHACIRPGRRSLVIEPCVHGLDRFAQRLPKVKVVVKVVLIRAADEVCWKCVRLCDRARGDNRIARMGLARMVLNEVCCVASQSCGWAAEPVIGKLL